MTTTLLFIAGLVGLVAGATLLVRGASRLALRLGISPLVVGLTVVAFGTSAPEMAVSVDAVLAGSTALAVGNVVGSNIFNILFILGLSALITPLVVHQQVIRQEAPIMIGGAALMVVLSLDGRIGLFDSLLLLGLLLGYTVFLVLQSRAELAAGQQDEYEQEVRPASPGSWDSGVPVQLVLVVAGLVLLVVGSDAMVSSAVVFARAVGMQEAVIGLTIVAAGTSLPEVAASVTASIKGERDIAVGNVVGSCVFNMFGVVGLSGLVAGLAGGIDLQVPANILQFDLWVMLAVSLACLPVFLTGRTIARWEAGLFLGYYIAYTTYLVLAAQRHGGTAAFGDAMLGFVVPLTLVTLMVSMVRRTP
jgi:cation:H+ antiporter